MDEVSNLETDAKRAATPQTKQTLQVSPKGRGPGGRSDHSAVAVDGTMLVIGGRSTTREFKDMYALDTELEPPVWTEASTPVL